jgi:hypothetical protein
MDSIILSYKDKEHKYIKQPAILSHLNLFITESLGTILFTELPKEDELHYTHVRLDETITEIPFHHVYYSVECLTGDWSKDGPFFDDVATAFSDGKKYIFDRQGCLYTIVDRSTVTGVSVESYHILPREGTKEPTATGKSLGNTDANGATKNVKDIVFWGDGETFKLISKASSQAEGWMKSTKAMQVGDAGVVVQVTTQQRNPDGSYAVAEALTFVPKAVIYEKKDEKGVVISRSLVG